jgi:signal transduction histidine kinase
MISDWKFILDILIKNSNAFGIGEFSMEGKLLDANDTMCFLLDTSSNELKPKNSLVNPDFKLLRSAKSEDAKIFDGIMTIGNYNDISYTLNSRVYKKGNSLLVFCEADISHLFDENKKMSRLNQEVNNLQRNLIKEKRKLQQTLTELKETQQMLIHSEKMNAMGKLVAGVAHEINNPISFVYGNIHSIEEYANDIKQSFIDLENLIQNFRNDEMIIAAEEIREKYDIDYLMTDLDEMTSETKNGLDRVKKIVEDLRKFSRLDESEVKVIDLVDNLKSTLRMAGAESKLRNISYSINVPKKLDIECYPGQLNQALLNIIINAIQAIEDKGEINISLIEKRHDLELSIKDDGCGIPSEIIDKIFEPFFTNKPVGSGTGLGLSITYKIIHDLHKGSIKVESEMGVGTKVTLTIPKKIIS